MDIELSIIRAIGRMLPPIRGSTAIINRVLKPLYLRKHRFLRIPVIATVEVAAAGVDALMITSLPDPQARYEAAIAVLGTQRVYVPSVLANTVTRSRPVAGAAKARARK